MKKRIGMAVASVALAATPLVAAAPAGAGTLDGDTKIKINNVRLCNNRCLVLIGGFGFPR